MCRVKLVNLRMFLKGENAKGRISVVLDKIADCNFDNFIVSRCNAEAFKVCMDAVADTKGKFIALYGPSFCGKSHLLAAFLDKIKQKSPDKQVLITTFNDLTIQYMMALNQNKHIGYRKMIYGYDILIIDNMQFAFGKPMIQEELMNWFCEMLDANKIVVIAFDCSKNCFNNVLNKLKQRYSAKCSIVEMFDPDILFRQRYIDYLLLTRLSPLSSVARNYLIYSKRIPLHSIRGILTKLEFCQNKTVICFLRKM